jgi:uncharacterized membrane protein required for colicin V production
VLAAVLLGFLINGARHGLFQSIASLLIVAVSLVGAGLISETFTQPLAASLQPYIEKRIEAKMDAALSSGAKADGSAQESAAGSSERTAVQMPDGTEGTSPENQKLEAQRLLSLLGLDQDPSSSIMKSVQEKAQNTGVSVMTAVAESVAETVLHVLLFAASFFVLMILLRVLMHAMDLVLKLPGLHFLNLVGGAAIGLAEGVLLLFLAVWVLRRLGVSLDTATVRDTVLLHFFTTNTPLSVLSFL